MLIKLDEHYRKFTNDFDEHEVEGAAVHECMSELCNRYPQLLVHLQDNQGEICQRSGLKLNGEYLVEQTAKDTPVCPADTLELTTDIPIGEDSIIKYIVGAVLIIVGVITIWAGGSGAWLISMGVSMIISTAVTDAFFTPESPTPPGTKSLLDNSYTYTFNGIRNTTTSGTPIQLVYGEHRVGGQVLNMYLSTEGGFEPSYGGMDMITTCNYLYAQIGLCEGEVQSVGDIQVNQLPQAFYNEVTFDYRVGTGAQTQMPNFSFVQNTTTINRKVLYGGAAQAVLSFSNYTPSCGYVSLGIPVGVSAPTLVMGMYTPVLTVAEAS